MALIMIPVISCSDLFAQKKCEDCARRAILDEFTNPNNPDYEQKREEWRQCMLKQLGNYVSFYADDPKVNAAAEICEPLLPIDHAYCFPAIVASFLGEKLTNPCFHMLSLQYFNPDRHRNPEYLFRGSYEGNIEGGEIVEIVTDVFKPIIARMNMKLYYNGTTPELVHEWNSQGTLNSPRGLLSRLNLPKNIRPILEEFEKRPATCEVKFPSQEELCENGTGEIILKGFRDTGGRPSREFNRIVVSIYKGEMLNGEKCIWGPDYRVFSLDDGEVKIRYRPPADKDDGYDWLRVYNSCDILPPEKHPLSETSIGELILDQHFPIFCGFYSGSISVTKTWDYTKDDGNSSTKYVGKQTVTFTGIFNPIPQMEGMEGQPIKIYGPHKVSGSWSHNEDRYCSGDCDCPGLNYQEYGTGEFPDKTLKEGLIIITNVFPTDIKDVADQLGQFGLVNWYDVATPTENVPTQTRYRHYIKDVGCVWGNSTSSTNLTGADVRFKLKDISNLSGSVSWSSSMGTTGISATDMTEAIYEQKPFEPEQDGTDYHYTITWNLKAL